MSANAASGRWTERKVGPRRAAAAWHHGRMSAGRRSVLALLTVLLLGAAGCGSGHDRAPQARSTDTSPSNGTGTVPDDLAIPSYVPRKATGRARPTSTRVIRRWLAALDRGDIRSAAHYFSLPSKFQNFGTPVLHIDSEEERIAINLSLTCGARAERLGGAGAFTIVLFRLIERPGPGGGCGSGTGGTARGAILVANGLIREWYRLPDEEEPGTDPAASGSSA
jgi:hypothetical protein